MKNQRCAWCLGSEKDEKFYIPYHDEEWGVPVRNDRKLFEMISLEGAQAGLSWITILKKRAGYLESFENFEIDLVAKMSEKQLDLLLTNPKIIRNRLKVYSVVKNAQAVQKIQAEFGGLSNYLWDFVDGKPIQNHWQSVHELPVSTVLSDQLSCDLKKRGLSFVGSTICYSFMQAVGMINDHVVGCYRYDELKS